MKSSKCPQAVVFDLVGTLVYPEPSVPAVYFHHGQRFGNRLSQAEIAQRFPRVMKSVDWTGADYESQRQSWHQIVASVFQLADVPAALFESLWEHFARASSWRLYADVLPNLRRLRDSGRWLAIGSNFDDRLHSICYGLGLTEAVDLVCGSSSVGYAKPDPRFFDALAQELQVSPDRAMMVGDDWEHDVAGASGRLDCQAVDSRVGIPQR